MPQFGHGSFAGLLCNAVRLVPQLGHVPLRATISADLCAPTFHQWRTQSIQTDKYAARPNEKKNSLTTLLGGGLKSLRISVITKTTAHVTMPIGHATLRKAKQSHSGRDRAATGGRLGLAPGQGVARKASIGLASSPRTSRIWIGG
ncbi:MAG: hypothetical protein ACIAQU_01550 [Phycisphaerales bacterium JB064]